jgi:CheY-like chemotaxis protein
LNDVVERSSKLLGRVLGEDIEIRMLLAEDLHEIRADALQLEQIILNLAVNARDAMPRGGKLTLETCNVEIDDAYVLQHVGVKPGPHAKLTVADNGCGMTAEVQQHIFEPFFTTKEVGKGSGLGLATVYGIVTQSDGHISVYSEVDVGTCFSMYFPQDESEGQATKRAVSLAAPATGCETILVVEDDVQVRSLLRRILTKAGYTVLLADNGVSAVELWRSRRGPVHLLITDVVMPKMSGKQLVECLSASQSQLKVLYMSGFTDDALGHHGVLEPGTPFLPKPFTSEQLKKKIRTVLDS